MSFKNNTVWKVNNEWSIFLDRDGTINKHLEGKYIDKWEDFEFIPGAIEAITLFRKLFNRVFIVTNQQGIGKELMTHEMLSEIHDKMIEELAESGAHFDQIYYCPDLDITDPPCRKPNPGMGFRAQQDFPEVNFRKSIMVGDQNSDILFGKTLQMKTVFLGNKQYQLASNNWADPDVVFTSLWEFAEELLEKNPIQ